MIKKSHITVKSFTIKNLKDLDSLAKQISKIIQINDIICFNADLGMGKTTFCKFLLKHLGVNETVISPTFSIIQTYISNIQNVQTNIHHIDLYRISYDELFELGIEEILNDGISLIEWSDKLESYAPKNYIDFNITENIHNERYIIIKYNNTSNPHWDFL